MDNWFTNKDETILKEVGSVMAELESIIEDEKTANYWIDDTHNIFAFVNNNGDTGDDDKWIEIHFELYDRNENIIGDLIVVDTESVNHKELYDEVLAIVKSYYGE